MRDIKKEMEDKSWAFEILNKYPAVDSIQIVHPLGYDSEKSLFAEEDKAYFKFHCLNRECIDGGFDLAPVIDDMVQKRQDKDSTKVRCWGWQDKERINKFHCLIEQDYSIAINYK